VDRSVAEGEVGAVLVRLAPPRRRDREGEEPVERDQVLERLDVPDLEARPGRGGEEVGLEVVEGERGQVVVTVNVRGCGGKFGVLAVTVVTPAAPGRVSVTWACPRSLAVTVTAESDPPPDVIVKLTVAPGIGFPFASETTTVSGIMLPADPLGVVVPPDGTESVAGGPASPVAVNVTLGVTVAPATVAVTAFGPAVVESVKGVSASPFWSVDTDVAATWPAPVVTVKVTGMLGRAMFPALTTRTTRGCGRVVPACPD
jgi:hypothetical protein